MNKVQRFQMFPQGQPNPDDRGLYVRHADYAALEAENERLREQVKALQSDANSWQSGYDKGRADGYGSGRKERDDQCADLEAARGRAEYWKQRAKSAEGHLWSSDAYAGARALHRYTRFEGTPWDELTGQQQALITSGAYAVIAEVNARREVRRPADETLPPAKADEVSVKRALLERITRETNPSASLTDAFNDAQDFALALNELRALLASGKEQP